MIFKPPQALPANHPHFSGRPRIFLAGSIEQGAAEEWQKTVEQQLVKWGAIVFNPRRDDWNKHLEQRASNAQFREQVEWELDALDLCDHVFMHFDPQTKSPITLLELGLYAESGKLVVSCPVGFWRLGNVELICERHGIPLVHSLKEGLEELTKYIGLTKRGHALREAGEMLMKLRKGDDVADIDKTLGVIAEALEWERP